MKKEAVAVFKLVQIYMSDRKAKVTLIIIIRDKWEFLFSKHQNGQFK